MSNEEENTDTDLKESKPEKDRLKEREKERESRGKLKENVAVTIRVPALSLFASLLFEGSILEEYIIFGKKKLIKKHGNKIKNFE